MRAAERVTRYGTGRWMGGALALVLAAPAAGMAGEPGYQITPSGYRTAVHGTFLSADGGGPVCRRLDADEIAASELDRLVRARSNPARPATTAQAVATGVPFVIVYTDAAGTGFDDAELGETRRAALVASLNAWSRVLVGTVPVTVEAKFVASENAGLLASAGPTDFVAQDGMLVPLALASQRAQTPANPGGADLVIQFSPQIQWDYVPDGVAAEGTYSFVYTAIHEIGHGLGFLGSFDLATGTLSNALPTPYDVHLNRGTTPGNQLIARSADLVKQDLTSSDLYFGGPNAVQASLASITPLPMVRLYAPATYEPASSVAHLDQETYANVLTGLMVPNDFGPDFAYVDSLALAIMADLGYTTDPLAIPAQPGQ